MPWFRHTEPSQGPCTCGASDFIGTHALAAAHHEGVAPLGTKYATVQMSIAK